MFDRFRNLISLGQSQTEVLFTPGEVKNLLKCSLPYVYKLADRGKLPCLRLPCLGDKQGRTLLRFKKRDIFNFIEASYQGKS